MTVPCPTCDRPANLTAVPEVAMGIDQVVVRVAGLARTSCEAGHEHVVPPDAVDRAGAEVAERLLVAGTRGVVRRRETCGACHADLSLPSRPSHRPVPVDVRGHVLTIVVEAPMIRCPACGRDQLTAAAGRHVPATIAAAIASARSTGGP